MFLLQVQKKEKFCLFKIPSCFTQTSYVFSTMLLFLNLLSSSFHHPTANEMVC